eukprot:15247006-Ditylum_brightwellii.AAC.1
MEENINCLRTLKSGKVTEYTEKINAQFGIGVPTMCAYQYCGDTLNLNIEAMVVQLIFAFDTLHNSVHHFYAWAFLHFTPVVRVKGKRIYVFNDGTDIDFILAAWRAGSGKGESKVTANGRREGYI